ncbi:MAG TPA: helix-turn-helix domain-containing protein [Aggregatilineales bacterium]|nr:TetR/AcrR family transcriptional regulator [Anaerolineales bacterium]HRE48332.1 helix-turn-helix domain-containing protein [Aggregatilineales bacterium]
MARKQTITDNQILAAAREIFLAEGFEASTADIAARAGVSSGSIFKRFPTKEALFFAAMNDHPITAIWVDELDKLLGKGDLRANLAHIAHHIYRTTRERLPKVMIAWSIRRPDHAETVKDVALTDALRLALFIGEEVSLGRLRPCDPAAVAQVIFGTATSLSLLEILQDAPIPIVEDLIHGVISVLWASIAPEKGG